MTDELIYTVGFGIFCSACGWVINSLYSRYVKFREIRTNRYQTALSEFYWPLYCILLELQGLCNDIENPHNESDLREMYDTMNAIIKEKMGFAFPKRAIARPIITLLTLLHKGNIENNTLKYVSRDCLSVVTNIVESRLFTMSKKYNALCDENEDIYTYALYTKIINQNTEGETLKEWISPYSWWCYNKDYKVITKDRREEVLDIFSQTLNYASFESNDENVTKEDIDLEEKTKEDIDLESFSIIDNTAKKKKRKRRCRSNKEKAFFFKCSDCTE